MYEFFTSASLVGTEIVVRGYNEEQKPFTRVNKNPTLKLYRVAEDKKEINTKFLSLKEEPLEEEDLNLTDYWRYAKKDDSYHGMKDPVLQELSKRFKGEIHANLTLINPLFFDIETEVTDTFPNAREAKHQITCITVINGKNEATTWTTLQIHKELLEEEEGDVIYCISEKKLLAKFIAYVREERPDFLVGYNSKEFDVPYIMKRILYLFPDNEERIEEKKKRSGKRYPTLRDQNTCFSQCLISPIYHNVDDKNKVKLVDFRRTYNDFDEEIDVYNIKGLPHLDYLELYKKYSNEKLPNNKLDTVAEHELGDKKLEHPYSSLKEFYEKDPTNFVRYNIKDVRLLYKLNKRLMFIELATTVAHFGKISVEDVLATTQTWDGILYNMALDEGIVVPPRIPKEFKESYMGAYVKEVIAGYHKNIVTFDFTSLNKDTGLQSVMAVE